MIRLVYCRFCLFYLPANIYTVINPTVNCKYVIMRPSSLGGGRILRRTLSVRLSVGLSVRPSRYRMLLFYFTAEPSYERTSKIEKLLFSLMGQRHVCTFRQALTAAYRTAISAVQDSCYYYYYSYTCKRLR